MSRAAQGPGGREGAGGRGARNASTLRPGGMRVYGGSVILEPGLAEEDFEELRAQGVWLAKAGFGAVETPFDTCRWSRGPRSTA